MKRQIIHQIVRPHIPDIKGDWPIMLSMMFMMQRIRRLSKPDLPGKDAGGIMKLSQLMITTIVVGRYD